MTVSVEYLVVAGGGGGGWRTGGGGGAGGLKEGTVSMTSGTSYTVTVGAGGAAQTNYNNGADKGNNGNDSSVSGSGISTITSTGGGGGGSNNNQYGATGGSGGGGAGSTVQDNNGTGTAGQGNDGGDGSYGNDADDYGGGGGGGAGAAGSNASPFGGPNTSGGNGGNGTSSSITGSSVTYAGGGGGGCASTSTGAAGTGGTGGGGAGGKSTTAAVAGTANTGGGGGGGGFSGGSNGTPGAGGSGVVILRHADTHPQATTTGSPTITTISGYIVYKFTGSGSITLKENTTINVTTSDVDIDAKDAALVIDSTISVNSTDIDLDAQDATVSAGVDATVSATSTNIDITSGNNNFNIEPIIATTSTNIGIEAHSVIIQSDTTRIIEAESPEITIDAKDAQVVTSSTITVIKSDIQIDGKDVNELYPTLVLLKNPIHYYRFIEQVNPATIKDYGSLPYDGTATNIDSSDYETGIIGDPISKSVLFNGSTSSGTEGVNFTPNKPLNRTSPNITFEFWFKTSSTDVAIFSVDANNTTLIGAIYGGQTAENWKYLGLRNGYFGITYEVSVQSAEKRGALTNAYLADGKWHHIVLTKKTVGSIITYNSYIDNQSTNIVISLGDLMDVDRPRQSLMAINNDNSNFIQKFNHATYLDEVAIYDTVFTLENINDHFISGGGVQPATISASSTNINVNGKSDIILTSTINPQVSNIDIASRLPSISDSANKIISAPVSNIAIQSHLPSLSIDGSIQIPVNKTNIKIIGKNNQEVVKIVDIKFISISDTNISAADADSIESIDFGGLLYNQNKIKAFKLGNTRNTTCNFTLRIISLESIIIPAILLSYDKVNYYSVLTIEGILANAITDPIYVSFDTNQIELLGSGTFLIDVEQNNAE